MATTTKADNAVHVALTEAPDAVQGAGLMQQAQGIVIRDRASHEFCREFLKGAKALKRSIEEHYAAIKKPLNEARNTVLDMEKRHLAPVLSAITIAEGFDTAYVREQRRLEEAAAQAKREEAEAAERRRRDEEAAAAERAALKLEASSNVLSEREQIFVAAYLRGDKTPNAILAACRAAKYADPVAAAKKLMASKKISDAIENAIKAERIRKESEAKQAAPITVDVKPVESQIGSVAGTSVRTYYSCGDVNLVQLCRDALKAYDAGDPSKMLALQANTVYLNEQARQLKTLFPAVWPSCKLGQRDGVAG